MDVTTFVRTQLPLVSLDGDALHAEVVAADFTEGDFCATTLLDLLMLDAALAVHGHQNPMLRQVIVDRARGHERPPVLTYEDIIFENPVDTESVRLFTSGEVGESEHGFYRLHLEIETALEAPVQELIGALVHGDPARVRAALAQAASVFGSVNQRMRGGGSFSREHFEAFRPFFSAQAEREGVPGPSGRFTALIPALDFLVRGTQLGQDRFTELEELWDFFPRRHHPLLSIAAGQARSGVSAIDIDPDAAAPLVQALDRFRGAHIRAIRTLIPEVIDGDGTGTGGVSDVRSFLQERLSTQ